MEFVYCEHITSYNEFDPYAMGPNDPYPYKYSLGKDKILVLCSKCLKTLAYEMITMFNRDSQRPESFRGFRR